MGALPAVLLLALGLAGGSQSLIDAVARAYDVPPHRILAPDWFRHARYDTVPGTTGPALQKALEEKYAIVAGFQSRPVETWVLECPHPGRLIAADTRGLTLIAAAGSVRGAATFEDLAGILERTLGADVVDETGMGGAFRFSLSWPARDPDAMVRAFREAGLQLTREYRDAKFLVIYSAFWPDAPKPPRHPCEAAPDLKRAIGELPANFESLKTLAEQYPEDIFAAMAAQDVFRYSTDRAAFREWALAQYGKMPDRPAAAFLEARLRSDAEPARAIALLQSALRAEPDFPQAQLLAARLTRPGAGREDHLRSFRERCPASLEDIALYGQVQDLDLLRSACAAFTRVLAARTDREALNALPHYWRVRRRAGPHWPPNWLELEVARIRQLDRTGDSLWQATLKAGQELLERKNSPYAYVEEWSEIVVLDAAGPAIRTLRPARRGRGPCRSILSIAWTGENTIAAVCHINPSLNAYIEMDIATGRNTRELLGYDFTPSPDGKSVAHVGWIVHFAPPFAQSKYLQIEHTTIYPLPDGMRPVVQSGLTEPPSVVRQDGPAYRGIHEFHHGIHWSPDSSRIALVDCLYDWTPDTFGALSRGGGKESGRRCFLAVVSTKGKAALFPLAAEPPRGARISWDSPHRISLTADSGTETFDLPR